VSKPSVSRDLIRRFLSAATLAKQARVHKSKFRLLGLLVLFDALLIAAVFLSFQSAELVEEVIELEQTREVYSTVVLETIITYTTVITKVVPYGSIQ
jgi:hypothetical protein